MIITEKNTRAAFDSPQFGDVVKVGGRLATYWGSKNAAQYYVQYKGSSVLDTVSSAMVFRTRQFNKTLRDSIEENISSRMADLKRKGGVKTGSRKRAGGQVQSEEPETKGPFHKLPTASGKHELDGNWEVQDKVPCNNCGKLIVPRRGKAEPFYCGECQNRGSDGKALVHSPIFGD